METEQTSLEDILNNTAPPEAPEVTDEATDAPQQDAEAETPASDAEKDVKEAAEPSSTEAESQKTAPDTISFAAYENERRKRQEIENRLARIEQERTQTPAPDPIEDPEAYTAFQNNIRQQERLQDRVAISEDIVRLHVGEDEYSKAEAAFADELERNPSLAAEAMRSSNPAMFLYKTGKAALERQEIGDPREFAAKQVAEALEKQKAEMANVVAKQVQEQLAKLMPKSLADNVSAESRSTQTPVDDGPVPLTSLIPE